MAVLAPEAPKAATPDGQEIVRAAIADIAKWEEGPDGSLYVYGKATTPEVDTDEQIVAPAFSGPALKTWLAEAPALRVMHSATSMPAGSGVRVEVNRDGDGAHWIKGAVDEPVAQMMVRKGHLRAFSVGIARPVIERDVTGKARGGIITGGRIVEVSLVDSPANRSCWLEMVKADKTGRAEFTGSLTAPDDVLAKFAAPSVTKTEKGWTTVSLPKSLARRPVFSPNDMAKLAAKRRELGAADAAKAATAGVTKVAEPEAARAEGVTEPDEALKAVMAAESAVYKRDIDTATRRRLASEGHALSDGSYPIETTGDLQNAATLARSGHGDVPAATALIGREARRLKVPDPLKKKPKGARKAARPDVAARCDCDGGMRDGKPCTECPKGRKKAKRMVRKALTAPDVAKKKGKLRAVCPGCGAKQNPEHKHCPECGDLVPARPLTVAKNHDYVCLGCGHALDKGEPHCPGCGKENPGYLPEADRKIPANQDAGKAAKERVAKKAKKGKKAGKGKKPFGGDQAAPFGADDEKEGDGKDKSDKAAAAAGKRKGKGKGRSPADGVKGHEGTTAALPPHREPDGPPVEQFEDDARLQDGDEAAEMAAAMRHKSLGIPPDLGVLHDLTCAAFSPSEVTKALPHATFAGIDTEAWQRRALDAAASADFATAQKRYNEAAALSGHAVTLRTADPQVIHDLRLEHHAAFLDVNKAALKAFRDATPGPGSFPSPSHPMPQSFRRPYVSAGHGAPSPQHDAPHSFTAPSGQISAQDFTRDHLTAGHAADSPSNDTPRHMPQPAPAEAGKPGRVFYQNTMRDNARQALTAMHDHICHLFPDVCPMSPEMGSTQKPAPQVPDAVGGPVPHAAGKSAKAAKRKARKQAKARTRKMAARRRRLERRVLKGSLTVEDARAKLGLEPVTKGAAPAQPEAAPPLAAALDPAAITAAVKAATAPLAKRIRTQDKALRKQGRVLDAIASQPDTSSAPFRGAGVTKSASPALAGPVTAAQSAEQAQSANLQRLQSEWRTSSDPARREAAYRELTAQLGLSPMTGSTDTIHPFRT